MVETKLSPTALPNGKEFAFWTPSENYRNTYYVNQKSPNACDSNPGTPDKPWKTISHAAETLMPGDRVIISGGIYREVIRPARGGKSSGEMICYEAAEGENVVVRGSVEVTGDCWSESREYMHPELLNGDGKAQIYKIALKPEWFAGYNPFGMVNLLGDITCLKIQRDPYESYILRRGLVFVDGKRLNQVGNFRELSGNTYWVDHNGMSVFVRFENDSGPSEHTVEVTNCEQLFVPAETGMGYIRVKGITFEQVGNGNPVPQHGVVSTRKGHHFVIEDCTVRHANATGIDIGNEHWICLPPDGEYSRHIVRRNTITDIGICGLAGIINYDVLIEDNLFENIGWQHSYLAWESGAIKLHEANDTLIRRNVIRHIDECAGIWLDCTNVNNRITSNILVDMPYCQEGLEVECTRFENMLDNNIVWNVGTKLKERLQINDNNIGRAGMPVETKGGYGCGILSLGSDFMIVVNNLVGKCYQAGFHADLIPRRLFDGRGGTARDIKIYNNLFYECENASVQFANQYNEADGNAYAKYNPNGGFLRIANVSHLEWLDLTAWRRFHGWDENGCLCNCTIDIDADTLRMKVEFEATPEKVSSRAGVSSDFFGNPAADRRIPGPIEFDGLSAEFSVDPRKI